MGVQDPVVQAASQNLTYRENCTLVGVGATTFVGKPWYVYGLPRQFLLFNQISAAPAMNVVVEYAIRDSAVAGVPEFLPHSTIVLTPGGATPTLTLLVSGATWLRFTVGGNGGQIATMAASAFV